MSIATKRGDGGETGLAGAFRLIVTVRRGSRSQTHTQVPQTSRNF